jgi:hypothetical protein
VVDRERVDTWLDLLDGLEGVAEVTATGDSVTAKLAENVV